ncbi:MAG: hypothetical protein Q9173_006935 [Seirophora scorigena]
MLESSPLFKTMEFFQAPGRQQHHLRRDQRLFGKSALPEKTFSSTNQAQQYQKAILAYFSVQDRLSPNCFVLPTSTKDVSKIVGLLSEKSCRFAIKSGGHGLPVGASNIDEGVTIDLGRMTDVTLTADKTTAAVQAGAKWGDV